jgi:hypothetical protein
MAISNIYAALAQVRRSASMTFAIGRPPEQPCRNQTLAMVKMAQYVAQQQIAAAKQIEPITAVQ